MMMYVYHVVTITLIDITDLLDFKVGKQGTS